MLCYSHYRIKQMVLKTTIYYNIVIGKLGFKVLVEIFLNLEES